MKRRIDTKLERERIGRMIRQRREELHLSVRAMSVGSGIAAGALSQLERGHNFTVHTLIRACAYLDLTIDLQKIVLR